VHKKNVWVDAQKKLRSDAEGICRFDGGALVVHVGARGGEDAVVWGNLYSEVRDAEVS
jgi:hypothetical protein